MKYWYSSIPFCLLLLCLGCASPSEKFLQHAQDLQMTVEIAAGSPFLHKIISNAAAKRSDAIHELHIYLDGDGTPWRTEHRIAEDPTARNFLILDMLAKDAAPAILLGRPCYYGLNTSAFCQDKLWTDERYGARVVNSMQAAIEQWLMHKKVEKLVLIGYSGGGVLATFLAAKLKNTSTVFTIAANLDVAAWCSHHGYRMPALWLNPMQQANIPLGIHQVHVAGLEDDNVPASIIESFSHTQANSVYLAMPKFDHGCCWVDIWPDILNTQLNH